MDSKLINRLNALSKGFEAGNMPDLKRIANDSIKEAAIENNPNLAKVAVIAYSLYKFFSKEHIIKSPHWASVRKIIVVSLEKSIEALQKDNAELFDKNMQNITKGIETIDNNLSNYARSTFEKAKIKQASTAYALGLSIGKSAELTGADPKQLQKYIGITKIHDEHTTKKNISERLEKLKGMLKE